MGAKYVQLATEGYADRAASSAVSTHAADTSLHVTAAEKSAWGAKSTVGVSATGTATDEVGYITVDGVEKKLAGGGTSDYTNLTNKPTLNGTTLTGAVTLAQVGAAARPSTGSLGADSSLDDVIGKFNTLIAELKA